MREMQRQLTLRATVAIVIIATSLVASLAAGFVLQGAGATHSPDSAASGALLGAAVYAPFALVALLLPALAVPMARVAFRGIRGADTANAPPAPWPIAVDTALLWIVTVFGLHLVGTLSGPPAMMAPVVLALLGVYAVIAAWLLHRRPEHDDSIAPHEPT